VSGQLNFQTQAKLHDSHLLRHLALLEVPHATGIM